MTLRCPYCRGTFEQAEGQKCPHCGKFVNLPPHLRPAKPLRVSRRERTSRYDVQHRETLTPTFQFGRKPSTLFIALAVLAVVGGLLLVRVAAPRKTHRRTRSLVALEAVDTLATATSIFEEECGRVPTDAEGFIVLISNPGIPGWDGPYINLIKPDPWEEPYRYSASNGVARIASCGPDKLPDTADDIVATTADL
ncbi:MAG: hypothetical protein HN919_14425 [Verrucomicrobia bacterium]|jgi:hypothetical protein|nr:hypothetical protein [Verrucomicrobiota bacterium]MBT7067494.1 hypothetical protein [Verrucomicrobiota bacterium]MBT7700980.1 hypothetical protein [Verrucomicrobiota bacterium]